MKSIDLGKFLIWALALAFICLVLVGVFGNQPAKAESGQASWYGGFFNGRLTANGERYNMYAMTCAHKTRKLGTLVTVTRADTGKSIVCRINDRGPYIRGRIIDLSKAGATALGILHSGTAKVFVE